MITSIFEALTEIVNAFVAMLVNLFSKVVDIFYIAPSGSNTTGSLTIVGTLALIGLATGLVIWAFHYVRSLIRVRNK